MPAVIKQIIFHAVCFISRNTEGLGETKLTVSLGVNHEVLSDV